MNRLNLDFSISSNEDRAAFVETYVQQKQFQINPLTGEELETIANYILWGKNPDTGKNVKQEKLIELESRSKTWDTKEAESLDALIETPTFRESQVHPIEGPHYKTPKVNFSRSECRKSAPPHILQEFESLWHQIDETDLIINYYDLAHGKRKNPPRDELLNRFTPEEQSILQERSTHLNQYKYLKMRHLLVEMRRQQFTLKDTYATPIQRHTMESFSESAAAIFGDTIQVLPFGMVNESSLLRKVFNKERFPIPSDFSETELKQLSDLLWAPPPSAANQFDFRNLEHLYQAFLMLEDLEEEKARLETLSTLPDFLETLDFYKRRAILTDIQEEILDMKISKIKNQDIADYVNKKYEKSYNANYISTIFRQKILKQIAAAAEAHMEIIENLFFPENFKQCKDCGEVLLLNANNFVRKSKSKDGFSVRCKKCEKILRNKREGKNK